LNFSLLYDILKYSIETDEEAKFTDAFITPFCALIILSALAAA
jgi:hypothetical protein